MPLTALKRFPLFRLLLAAAVGYAWWRSHSKTDVLALFFQDGKANLFASDRGRAVYIWTNISLGPRRPFTYDALHGTNEKFSNQRETFYETPPVPERVAGVWLGSGTGVMGMPDSRYRMISVPFWELSIVVAIPLLLGLRTFWRRRLWGTPGHCGACGYDTRFSTDRCPECGAELAAQPAA
jgi:hypothetical protein